LLFPPDCRIGPPARQDCNQFVQQETVHRSGFGRKHPDSAIRVFLGYPLVSRGLLQAGLEAAVPGMRIWKHASLPEALTVEEVTRLLARLR